MEENKNVVEEKAEKKQEVNLGEDFYMKLLHLPACKSKGYCDNCGRCER